MYDYAMVSIIHKCMILRFCEMKEIKQKLRSNQIFYGDSFFIAYSQYMDADPIKTKEGKRTPSNIINEKKYTIKDTDATYRTINHWAKLGLIDDDRENEGKGWRKFSIVDLVWLGVLKQLREYGFSLEKIKKGYDAINDMPGLLEFGIYMAMAKQAVYLIVLPDGYIELATRSSLLASESTGLLVEISYLVINLNNCLMSFLPNINYRPKSDTYTLSKKEVN